MENYMMINRNQLLKISDLNLTGKIEQMDEGKLGNFIQLLNSFSDNLPSYEKKIKDALYAKDYDSLTKHLSALRDILAKIYAEEMAQDCTTQIGKLGSEKHEKIEAYMRYFLSSLAILSTDIQKAQKQADGPSGATRLDAARQDAAPDDNADSKKVYIERLLESSESKLAGKIEKLGEGELDNYLQLLNTFTENFPTQEEEINEALKNKDVDAFVN
jgi:HPt (histidine-containing phosphotransfer) domain-containing protein